MKKITCISLLFMFIIQFSSSQEIRSDEFKLRDLKETSFPELGLTSYGINLGYWHKRTGLRLSHYYLNETRNGMMLNLGYKLSDNQKTQKCINLLAGRYVGSDPGADYDFTYVGISYGLNFF